MAETVRAEVIALWPVDFPGGSPRSAVGRLKKRAVTAAKIKGNAVTGSKIRNDSLTGSDVVESSLGKVPSAGSADTGGERQHGE